MLLERISKANDIKSIPMNEMDTLASEIREFIIEHVSITGGHLAANLGVVEITMALHLFLDLPKDKLIFDVGHQCYTHKILTGRKDDFDSLRQYKGLSGFPKREESECDSFDSGHSSNSISVALGYAASRELTGTDEKIVALIGDGAMTGGIAYEALNNAMKVNKNFIIVLNDNTMSISENVGGLSLALSKFRTAGFYTGLKKAVHGGLDKVPLIGEQVTSTIRKTKNGIKQLFLPGMFFEEMGIKYFGPVDGHNVKKMLEALEDASRIDGPVIIHAVTTKGKGYEFAENHPARFHGTGPFDIGTGLTKKGKPKYQDIFSTVILKLAQKDERVVAITAAMEDGTGLRRFRKKFPERFYDVGIAEQHAVSFAAGLALGGLVPIFAVYSSFLQRAYDEIVQDICMQKLHVIFAIDRSGLVGDDGPTHHGVFDFSYLSMLPNMTILAPKNLYELSDMMKFAVSFDGPIAIRYPRGEACDDYKELRMPINLGKAELLHKGSKVCLLSIGAMVKIAMNVMETLKNEGIDITVVNMRFVKPLDVEIVDEMVATHDIVYSLEDASKIGGLGDAISRHLTECGHYPKSFKKIGIKDEFIEQGKVSLLYKECNMDEESIANMIRDELR